MKTFNTAGWAELGVLVSADHPIYRLPQQIKVVGSERNRVSTPRIKEGILEQIDFCEKYCPIPARWVEFPKVDNDLTIDCDLEEGDCPFKDVDFSKVTINQDGDGLSSKIQTVIQSFQRKWSDGTPQPVSVAFRVIHHLATAHDKEHFTCSIYEPNGTQWKEEIKDFARGDTFIEVLYKAMDLIYPK